MGFLADVSHTQSALLHCCSRELTPPAHSPLALPCLLVVLRSLQGKVMPRLLCHGNLYPTDAFILAISDEGQNVKHCRVPMSEQLFGQAREALEALHGAGICHGDVRASNLILREDGTVCLVDFEQAEFLERLGSMKGRAARKSDLDSLEYYLGTYLEA